MVKQLSDSDTAILQHVAQYRLTLPSLLAKAGIVPNEDVSAAAAALRDLVSNGWLARSPLSPGHSEEFYFHLAPRGAEYLRHDPEMGIALPRELRIESFAIATYCLDQIENRILLTKSEFKEQFQQLWLAGQPVRYCLERDDAGATRLAFLKVERDDAGHWARVIDACERFLAKRIDTKRIAADHRPQAAAFDALVKRGQFTFTVLVALAEKKRAIEIELELRAGAGETVPPIQVHVVPGLFELLYPEFAHAIGDRASQGETGASEK
jgi:hypothetical protein